MSAPSVATSCACDASTCCAPAAAAVAEPSPCPCPTPRSCCPDVVAASAAAPASAAPLASGAQQLLVQSVSDNVEAVIGVVRAALSGPADTDARKQQLLQNVEAIVNQADNVLRDARASIPASTPAANASSACALLNVMAKMLQALHEVNEAQAAAAAPAPEDALDLMRRRRREAVADLAAALIDGSGACPAEAAKPLSSSMVAYAALLPSEASTVRLVSELVAHVRDAFPEPAEALARNGTSPNVNLVASLELMRALLTQLKASRQAQAARSQAPVAAPETVSREPGQRALALDAAVALIVTDAGKVVEAVKAAIAAGGLDQASLEAIAAAVKEQVSSLTQGVEAVQESVALVGPACGGLWSMLSCKSAAPAAAPAAEPAAAPPA